MTAKRKAAVPGTNGKPSTIADAAEIMAWVDGLVPDFRGRTQSGLFFTLYTWKIGRQQFYSFGYATAKQGQNVADEQAKINVLKTRLA